MTFGGFEIEDIDAIAQPLLQALEDTGEADVKLHVLALCRAITLIGKEKDLDTACQMIDEMADFLITEALALMDDDDEFDEVEDDVPLDHLGTLELDDDGDDDENSD